MSKKKLLLIVAIVLILFAVSSGCVQEEKKVYTVGVNAALEPFSAKSIVTGEPYGMDVDLINYIAKDQGFEVNYVYVQTSEFMDKLDAGEIDIQTGKVMTDERKARCDFSDVYYSAKYGLVTRKDSEVTENDVLAGKASVAVNSGSAYETWLKKYHGEDKYNQLLADGKIIIKSSVNSAIQSVVTKEADSAMTSGGSIGDQLSEYTMLKFAGFVSENENEAGFAVKKGNSELVDKLNKGLKSSKDSGEYDKIVEKYGIPILNSEYTIGVETNTPWVSVDSNGEYTGYDVESLKWIGEQNGIKFTFINVPWSENINAIIYKDIDLFASGMSITSERLEKIGFSNPYVVMGTAIISKDSGVSKADFESGNCVVGVIYGTNHVDVLTDVLGDEKYDKMADSGKIKTYESRAVLEEKLKSGEIDVYLQNEAGADYSVNTLKFNCVTIYPNTDEFAYAMRNGDVELINVINDGIAELESSGKKAELIEKYGL